MAKLQISLSHPRPKAPTGKVTPKPTGVHGRKSPIGAPGSMKKGPGTGTRGAVPKRRGGGPGRPRTVADVKGLDPVEEQVILAAVNMFGDEIFDDVKKVPLGHAVTCLKAVIEAAPTHRNVQYARDLLKLMSD